MEIAPEVCAAVAATSGPASDASQQPPPASRSPVRHAIQTTDVAALPKTVDPER
jgi:hypothetical protein